MYTDYVQRDVGAVTRIPLQVNFQGTPPLDKRLTI